jgi:hypothetical protein
MHLTNAEDIHENDEINLYLRGRYLCSMDAMWRCLGYQTYPSPTPSVTTVHVKMPADVAYYQEKRLLTDIDVYFHRPAALHHLTFTQFFTEYIYNKKQSARTQDENVNYFRVQMPQIPAPIYICKRSGTRNLVRMLMIYPSAGEVWYLRVLLLNRPCASFQDALTHEGHLCTTFQQSALLHGYVDDQRETTLCFQEALLFKDPRELRSLFAFLVVQGFPTHHLFFDDTVFDAMTDDYNDSTTIVQSKAAFLCQFWKDLQLLLSENGGKSLQEYGFPEPQNVDTEMELHLQRYDVQQQNNLLHTLNEEVPNNDDQQNVYNVITTAVNDLADADSTGTFFFVKGQGGCGKTTIAKKIMAYTRSTGKIALGCASTGLAATLYDDFYTAHALFCYPVIEEDEKDESEPAQCEFEKNEDRRELVTNASLIVWDEMICNHKELFEAAYRATNGFAGTVVVCMGDFRQIMPVLKHANRHEVRQSCITSSYLWYKFHVFSLSINMRLELMKVSLRHRRDAILQSQDNALHEQVQELTRQLNNQTNYGEMILSIGEGRGDHEDACVMHDCAQTGLQIYRIDSIPHYIETNIEDALHFLYPTGFNMSKMIKCSILAATNEQVDTWNKRVQLMNTSETHTLLSTDKLSQVDDPNSYLENIINDDVLHEYVVNGVPPHDLQLKRGDICLIMRNLSKRYGLATNSRVIILSISEFCIRVQTVATPTKTATIPRIRFRFKIPGGASFEVTRTQFPLRLAYCMTYNKAQGQTLESVLLDITSPPFAHGHLYVALSRVTHYANIKVFCNDKSIWEDAPLLSNIVYPELLPD